MTGRRADDVDPMRSLSWPLLTAQSSFDSALPKSCCAIPHKTDETGHGLASDVGPDVWKRRCLAPCPELVGQSPPLSLPRLILAASCIDPLPSAKLRLYASSPKVPSRFLVPPLLHEHPLQSRKTRKILWSVHHTRDLSKAA